MRSLLLLSSTALLAKSSYAPYSGGSKGYGGYVSPIPDVASYGYTPYDAHGGYNSYQPKAATYDEHGYDAYGQHKDTQSYDDGYNPHDAQYADYQAYGYTPSHSHGSHSYGHSTKPAIYDQVVGKKDIHHEADLPLNGFNTIGYGGDALGGLPEHALDYKKHGGGKGATKSLAEAQSKHRHDNKYAAASIETNNDGYNQEIHYNGGTIWADANGHKRGYEKGEDYENGGYAGYDKASNYGGNSQYVQDDLSQDYKLAYNVNHALHYKNKYKDENHKGSYKGDEFDISYKAQDVNGGYAGKETQSKYEGAAYDGSKNNGKAYKGGNYNGNDYIKYGDYSKEGAYVEYPSENPAYKDKDSGDDYYYDDEDGRKNGGYDGGDGRIYYDGGDDNAMYHKFKSGRVGRKSPGSFPIGTLAHGDDSASKFRDGRPYRVNPHSVSSDRHDLGNYAAHYGMQGAGDYYIESEDNKGGYYGGNGGGSRYGSAPRKGNKGGNDKHALSNKYGREGSYSKDGSFRGYGANYKGSDYYGKNKAHEGYAGAEEKTSNKLAYDNGNYRAVDAKGHNKAAKYQGDYQTNDKEHQVYFNVKHTEDLQQDFNTDVKIDQYAAGYKGKEYKGGFSAENKYGSYKDAEFANEIDKNKHVKHYEGESFVNGFSGETAGIFYSGAHQDLGRERSKSVYPAPKDSSKNRRHNHYYVNPYKNNESNGRSNGGKYERPDPKQYNNNYGYNPYSTGRNSRRYLLDRLNQ